MIDKSAPLAVPPPLPAGQHVSISYMDKDGRLVSRAYTPTSSDHELG